MYACAGGGACAKTLMAASGYGTWTRRKPGWRTMPETDYRSFLYSDWKKAYQRTRRLLREIACRPPKRARPAPPRASAPVPPAPAPAPASVSPANSLASPARAPVRARRSRRSRRQARRRVSVELLDMLNNNPPARAPADPPAPAPAPADPPAPADSPAPAPAPADSPAAETNSTGCRPHHADFEYMLDRVMVLWLRANFSPREFTCNHNEPYNAFKYCHILPVQY